MITVITGIVYLWFCFLPAVHIFTLFQRKYCSDKHRQLCTNLHTFLHKCFCSNISQPEVGSKIGDNVGMAAVLHHENLLLDDAEVVPRLQLDHLNGRVLARRQSLRLQLTFYDLPVADTSTVEPHSFLLDPDPAVILIADTLQLLKKCKSASGSSFNKFVKN